MSPLDTALMVNEVFVVVQGGQGIHRCNFYAGHNDLLRCSISTWTPGVNYWFLTKVRSIRCIPSSVEFILNKNTVNALSVNC